MILLYPKYVNEVYYYFNMAEDEEAFHQVKHGKNSSRCASPSLFGTKSHISSKLP